MFAYIDVYLRFRAGEISLLDYLWRAHGEHHLVWIRLLTWADVELFRTRSIPFVIAATAAVITSAVLVWRQLRHAQPKLGAATSMGLLAPMLMLSTANVTDCSVPINTTYPFTVCFAVLALVLFAGAGAPGSGADLRRLGAVLAAFGASMGTAAGLLTWPILLWVAWRERLNWGWLATMAGLSVIYSPFYARDLFFLELQPALHKDAASFVDAAHLYSMSYYFFTFLGLPFTREPSLGLMGFVIGGTLFLAGSYAVVIATSTNRLTTQLDRIATGMILLAFGSAALAAVGRSDLSDGLKVPVRYTMFATMLQVGLLCLILPRAVQRFDSVQGRVFFVRNRSHVRCCTVGHAGIHRPVGHANRRCYFTRRRLLCSRFPVWIGQSGRYPLPGRCCKSAGRFCVRKDFWRRGQETAPLIRPLPAL